MNVGLASYYAIGIAATFIVAVLSYVIAQRRGWEVPRWLLVVAIAIVPPLLLVQQLLKYASLHMYADFSHWLQLFQSIVHTGVPIVMNQGLGVPGTAHYFSVHFVPLTYVLAVPFALLPRAEMLIILNVLLMVSATIPLYLIARLRFAKQNVGGLAPQEGKRFALLMAALLLWYPTFQYVTLYEFEMLRFSIPLMFWMLYAWERQRIGWYYVCVLLVTLVREEVGLTVGMFGVFLMFVRREWRHGFVTAVLGFGAFGFITGALMPAFRSDAYEHVALGAFDAFGRTPLDVAVGVFAHPFRAAAVILEPMKLANFGMLFLPVLFLPLLAPTALIPVLPTLGIVFLSAVTTHASYMLYYVAPAVPFVFFACIVAWFRITAWFARRMGGRYGANASARASSSAMGAIVVGMLVVGIFFGPSPIALQFWSDRFRPAPFRTQSFHWSIYRVTNHHRALDGIIPAIPRDAIVSAPQFFMPRLASRRGVLVFPELVSKDGTYHADYVLFDETNNGIRPESPAYVTDAEMDIVRTDTERWELVQRRDAYALYRLRP